MKVLIFKKATLAIISLVLIFLTAFSLGGTVLDVGGLYFTTAKKYPIYSVETQENKVAISFDAAWGADKTTDIMRIWRKSNFFSSGILD